MIKLKKEVKASILTEREVEVLRLQALGLTQKEIAGRLYLSVSSIKTCIVLPALPTGSDKFIYVVSGDSNPVPRPNHLDNWAVNAGNILMPGENTAIIDNGRNIGIAAVATNTNNVVQFINVVAVTEVEDLIPPTIVAVCLHEGGHY